MKNMLKGVLKISSRKAIEIHVFVTFQQKKKETNLTNPVAEKLSLEKNKTKQTSTNVILDQ